MSFSLFETSNGNKGACRIDARLKVFLIFFFSISIFFVRTIIGLSQFAFVLLLYIGFSKRIEFRGSPSAFKQGLISALKISTPIYIICAFSFFANALTMSDSSLYLTQTGIYKGAFFALRILLLAWFSLYVANTISVIEFANVFKLTMLIFRRFKFPVDEAAMTVSIALRFIPQVFIEFQTVKEAQWSRGARMDFGGIVARTKSYASCFIPLLVKMINSTENLGRALDARCFGCTSTDPRQDFERISRLHLFLTIVIMITLILVATFL